MPGSRTGSPRAANSCHPALFSRSIDRPCFFDDACQAVGIIGHDSVDTGSNQPPHGFFRVDRPNGYCQVAGVGCGNELRRHDLQSLESHRYLQGLHGRRVKGGQASPAEQVKPQCFGRSGRGRHPGADLAKALQHAGMHRGHQDAGNLAMLAQQVADRLAGLRLFFLDLRDLKAFRRRPRAPRSGWEP